MIAPAESPRAPNATSGDLPRRILVALRAGVSGREQPSLHGKDALGASKSGVSRLWVKEGEKILEAFRERDTRRPDWLMLDGVVLDRDMVAIEALGIAMDGTKHLLDFEFGATENSNTAKSLLERLVRRGFSPMRDCRLYVVLDGANALKTVVSAYFPNARFQRRLVHKERNLRRYLRQASLFILTGCVRPLAQLQGSD